MAHLVVYPKTTSRPSEGLVLTGTITGAGDEVAIHTKVKNTALDPIPVNVVSGGATLTYVDSYNEITGVASGSETTILTYTVPLLGTLYLEQVSVSGTNIAEYRVKVNGTVIDKAYTWFNGNMSHEFNFESNSGLGRKLLASDVLIVTVLHGRPSTGNFNARIQGESP